MRIGGIASGLDTETIVRDLMRVERLPLDRFFQQKQRLEWQRDSQREMNLILKNLDDVASNIRLRSHLNTRQATTSPAGILSATANAAVRNGAYTVDVKNVAKAERYMSTAGISANADEKISTSRSLESQESLFKDSNFGNEFTITTYKKNAAGETEEQSKRFEISGSMSLNDIFKEINGSNLGVRAYYDTVFDRVVIERTETGIINEDGNEIVLSGALFSNVLKIGNDPIQEAENAEFIFINTNLKLEEIVTSRTNRNTVGGITIDLVGKGQTNITVTSNTDDAFSKIKEFVNKYNETIDIIRGKLNEPVHRGFPPLTDEQRRELSEREAELWDEKAKSGLLRRDQNLTSSLNQMRLDLFAPVSGTGQYNQLAQIGITTSRNYLDGGKLEINEEKLRAALADDPDSVHQLLNNTADTQLTRRPVGERTLEESQLIYNQTGLVGRLRNSINDTIKRIVAHAGNENRASQQYTIGREINGVDKQMDRFQRRLTDIENRYWSQFTAMEKAMNQANSQAMAFMSQLMGTGN